MHRDIRVQFHLVVGAKQKLNNINRKLNIEKKLQNSFSLLFRVDRNWNFIFCAILFRKKILKSLNFKVIREKLELGWRREWGEEKTKAKLRGEWMGIFQISDFSQVDVIYSTSKIQNIVWISKQNLTALTYNLKFSWAHPQLRNSFILQIVRKLSWKRVA